VNAQQQNEFDKFWDEWFSENVDKLAFKAKGENGRWSVAAVVPTLLRLSEAYVEKHNNGFASRSMFSIVLNLMIESRDLVPIHESPQIPAEIADFINKAESGRISTYELRRRYMSDKAFRDFYDVHSGIATPQPIQLTADEYHRIPSRTAQARYRQEPAFRAAVDGLHASGRV